MDVPPATIHAARQIQLVIEYEIKPKSLRYGLVMQYYKALGLFVLVSSWTAVRSQSSLPDSRGPGKKQVYYAPARSHTVKAKKGKAKHTARYEFYKRVEKAAKEKQWAIRKLSKPQFSDPRYFGHKRVPLRRQSNKMRYCNECGIRH